MGFGRAPYAPADAEGDEQSYTNEDGRTEPQRNLHLMDVSLQPRLDADVGHGESHHSRSQEHHQLLGEEEPQDVAHLGSEHLAHGNLLAPLFATDGYQWIDTEQGYQDADSRHHVEQAEERVLGVEQAVEGFIDVDNLPIVYSNAPIVIVCVEAVG